MTSGTQVLRLDGHKDYVRAAAVSPASEDTWATGGYDHAVKVRRTASRQGLRRGGP